jgi:transcriptional regulator with GAF, ATPase, and Fis domain
MQSAGRKRDIPGDTSRDGPREGAAGSTIFLGEVGGLPLAREFVRELGESMGKPIEHIAASERAPILQTLEQTGWRILGPGGAAERLAVKPTTLESRSRLCPWGN